VSSQFIESVLNKLKEKIESRIEDNTIVKCHVKPHTIYDRLLKTRTFSIFERFTATIVLSYMRRIHIDNISQLTEQVNQGELTVEEAASRACGPDLEQHPVSGRTFKRFCRQQGIDLKPKRGNVCKETVHRGADEPCAIGWSEFGVAEGAYALQMHGNSEND
jgi:hypothetical protein